MAENSLKENNVRNIFCDELAQINLNLFENIQNQYLQI